jgi:hypothetical protein
VRLSVIAATSGGRRSMTVALTRMNPRATRPTRRLAHRSARADTAADDSRSLGGQRTPPILPRL